jgi:hypothetical protein
VSTKWTSACVIGTGVAGCLSALALKTSTAEVTLIGKAPGLLTNYCMTVGPAFVRHLETLGLGPSWRNWQGKCERTAHLSAWGTNTWEIGISLFDPFGPSYMVQRAELELFLLEQALLQGVRHHIATIGPATLPRPGTLVIDATGRAALMARRSGGVRRSLPPLVALHGQGPATLQESGMTTLVSGPDGWWFSATMGQTTSVCLVIGARSHRCHSGNWRDVWRAVLPLQPALRQYALASDGLGRPLLAGSSWLEKSGRSGMVRCGRRSAGHGSAVQRRGGIRGLYGLPASGRRLPARWRQRLHPGDTRPRRPIPGRPPALLPKLQRTPPDRFLESSMCAIAL